MHTAVPRNLHWATTADTFRQRLFHGCAKVETSQSTDHNSDVIDTRKLPGAEAVK